ncbi:MAG: tetratricopeptide repeat protein, partial [Solirubrobacteraceae bacterium]
DQAPRLRTAHVHRLPQARRHSLWLTGQRDATPRNQPEPFGPPGAVVELSRAVAVAEEQGPEAGLEIIDRLALEDYHYLHSTQGELLRRLGRTDEARNAYRRALALVSDDAERRLLERRLAELPG